MASWSSFLFSSARRSPTLDLTIALALGGATLVASGGCTLNTAGISAGGSGGTSSTSITTSTTTSVTSVTSVTSTTTSTSSATTSTSTGPTICTTEADCGTAPKGSCMKRVCKASVCDDEIDTTNTPGDDQNPCTKDACSLQGAPHPGIATGAPCEGQPGVCDSSGKCIGCLKDDDCKTGTKPSCDTLNHICISCSDGIKNGSETDKDCGGSCGACNGTGCGTNPALCASGNCVDNVCCDTACTGDCQACNINGSMGTCSNLSIGTLDASCPNLKACDGAGNCKLTSSNACAGDADCLSGICYVGLCRVQAGGDCMDDLACGSGLCKNNTVCADCTLGSQCKSTMCNVTTCKAPGGAPCDVDDDCAGGKCQFNLCMVNNGSTCSTNADCRSGYCKNGTCTACGGNNDCSGNGTCKNTIFGMNTCELPTGAYCINDGYCAAASGSKCLFTFPRKCQ